MSILGKAKRKKIIAVLDIAGGEVGGMLIEQGSPIKVISSVSKPANFLFDVDFEAAWRCSADALKKVIGKLLRDFPSGPDAVLCVFSSPWFVSQVKTVSLKKEKPFEIKKSFFDELFYGEEKKFKETYSLPGLSRKDEVKFIEHENIKTEINGYLAKSPIGKEAKTVKADFYFSLAKNRVVDGVTEEVLKNFGDVPLLFKTFPPLAVFTLRNIARVKENFLALDIGGETTDIYLIKNNALNEVASFLRGTNFLVRNITSELKTFLSEALSMIKTYLRGHRLPENSGKLEMVIEKAKEEWRLLFGKTIAGLAENIPLPQVIFLLNGTINNELFADCVRNEEFAKFTILGKPLKVINVKPDWMSHYFVFNSAAPAALLDQGKNIALLFDSFFANQAF